MACNVVEVVARFGDTILEVVQVSPTEQFRIGTAPDVDLAVPGQTSFPLVDCGNVRCPIGVPVEQRGKLTVLTFGRITLELTRRTVDRKAALARLAPFECRTAIRPPFPRTAALSNRDREAAPGQQDPARRRQADDRGLD